MIWLAQHRDAFLLALRRLSATPLNTLLSVLAIGIAASLPAGGQMLLGNLMSASRGMAGSPQISVFMAVDAERKASQEVEGRLRRHAGVKALKFAPREDTLARMKSSAGLGEVIDALPRNPFPDAFVIAPADERPEALEGLAADVRKLPRVDHVQLDSAWVQRLDALLRLGRTAVMLLALLLGVGLVAITFNTIRLQVLMSRAEIEISRLLGATDGFVRRPYYWFGALQGLLGGAAAWLIVAGTTFWLSGPIAEIVRLYSLDFSLRPPGAAEAALLLGATAGLGWLGAVLSVRQHLAGQPPA